MSLSTDTFPPHLQPPGAGLPQPELLVARALFAFMRWRGNRDTFTAHFERERAAVRRRVDGLDAAVGVRRVLIRRVPGMEDSSRFWSVWMTLDHLRIMHVALARVIGSLVRGVVPERGRVPLPSNPTQQRTSGSFLPTKRPAMICWSRRRACLI